MHSGIPFDSSICPDSTPKTVLTIAGFDPSSGAGITADLQVFAAFGLFGTACITALTVQSTTGVVSVTPVPDLIGPTLRTLDADLPPAGFKIGMLGTAEAVRAVTSHVRGWRATGCPVVLDPVLLSSSGAALLDAEGVEAMKQELLPVVDWITPNRAELAVLSGCPTGSPDEADAALLSLRKRYPHLHIVATGGELSRPVDTLLTPDGKLQRFDAEHIDTTSTHGTGCAFSSALLARLVLGDAPEAAVHAAKAFVTQALLSAPGLGRGRGPMNLLWPLQNR